MKYIPITTVPTKDRFDVYNNGKLILSTFNAFSAEVERQMGWGNIEIKITKVSK